MGRYNPKHDSLKAKINQKQSKLDWTYGSVDFLFKQLTAHGLLAVEEGPAGRPQFRIGLPTIRSQVEFLLTAMEAWGMITTDPKTKLVSMVKPPTISAEDWAKKYPPPERTEEKLDPNQQLIEKLNKKDEAK